VGLHVYIDGYYTMPGHETCLIWTSFALSRDTLCRVSIRPKQGNVRLRLDASTSVSIRDSFEGPQSDVHAHEQKRVLAGQWADRV
jgi:hypothetical protein